MSDEDDLRRLRNHRASLRGSAQICFKSITIGLAIAFSTIVIFKANGSQAFLAWSIGSGASLMHDGNLQARRKNGDFD